MLSRVRRVRAALLTGLGVISIVVLSGCSSPTARTPPPTATPPPDGTPALTISCPAAVTAASTTGQPVGVTFPPPVTSGGRAPVQVSCTPPSGSLFPVGATSVQCTATDALTLSSSCNFSVTVAAVPRLGRTTFVAFGDSFTAGEVAIPGTAALNEQLPNFRLAVVPSASYPTLLTSLLRGRYTAQTIQMTNSGVPSEWAEDGAKRLPGVLSSTRPEVLLLLEGVNELSALGQPGVARAWAAIDTMAKEGRNRGARVFLATLPPPRPPGKGAVPLQLVLALNDRIRTTAAGEGAVLVDLYAALNVDLVRYIGVDGLHPTELGYQRIADTFFDAIRAVLEVR
jgi:lysophospholipase L1-like esterase